LSFEDSQQNLNLAFVGAGNMASSIIGGLVNSGFNKQHIHASDPRPESLTQISEAFGVQTSSDNASVVNKADVVIIAVKPQVMGEVCTALKPHLTQDVLVISIAAGIDCRSLNHWLGDDVAIVRCMPNTPAMVSEGATGLFASKRVNAAQRRNSELILSAVGSTHWVQEEQLLDAVTAVSGSGPAYFFLVLEAMTDAGVKLGLEKNTAEELAIQTALGAAKLAKASDVSPAELRRRVTSPNGTTERAIASFENNKLRNIFAEAMSDCAARSSELAKELGV